MLKRTLGRSGIEVAAVGMGCWAIGGPNYRDGQPTGWGDVDDEVSLRALAKALELGATLFDTADGYGNGHSERLLGKALAGRRDQAVIATKVGYTFKGDTREMIGESGDPDYIRQACEASLTRLGTDYIDIYQFHLGRFELGQAEPVRDVMEQLVAAGKIRWYGWSTDSPERAALFAAGEHCTAIQQRFNIFEGNAKTLAICAKANLASINRGPLAMGLLTGKYGPDTKMPADDVRHRWNLQEGPQARNLAKLNDMRDVLTSDGRTLAQGALCWLLARSEVTVPIPGFKTPEQVADNIGAAVRGPLSGDEMAQIDEILQQ